MGNTLHTKYLRVKLGCLQNDLVFCNYYFTVSFTVWVTHCTPNIHCYPISRICLSQSRHKSTHKMPALTFNLSKCILQFRDWTSHKISTLTLNACLFFFKLQATSWAKKYLPSSPTCFVQCTHWTTQEVSPLLWPHTPTPLPPTQHMCACMHTHTHTHTHTHDPSLKKILTWLDTHTEFLQNEKTNYTTDNNFDPNQGQHDLQQQWLCPIW